MGKDQNLCRVISAFWGSVGDPFTHYQSNNGSTRQRLKENLQQGYRLQKKVLGGFSLPPTTLKKNSECVAFADFLASCLLKLLSQGQEVKVSISNGSPDGSKHLHGVLILSQHIQNKKKCFD